MAVRLSKDGNSKLRSEFNFFYSVGPLVGFSEIGARVEIGEPGSSVIDISL
jgi:hypothetical protein